MVTTFPVLRKIPCARAYNTFRDKDLPQEHKRFLRMIDIMNRNEAELNLQMRDIQRMLNFQKRQLMIINKFYRRCSEIADKNFLDKSIKR
jgi:hypothetical protein